MYLPKPRVKIRAPNPRYSLNKAKIRIKRNRRKRSKQNASTMNFYKIMFNSQLLMILGVAISFIKKDFSGLPILFFGIVYPIIIALIFEHNLRKKRKLI